MASSKGKKRTLSEKVKNWCKNSLCYCSLANKTSSIDPGDVPLPTPHSPHPEDTPHPHPEDMPPSTARKQSADSDSSPFLVDSGDPTQSPGKKSVKFLDEQTSEEEDLPPTPLSPSSLFMERRGSLRRQSTLESQLEELPKELRSLETKLTNLFGNGFFRTVDEEDSEAMGDDYLRATGSEEWDCMDMKLQIAEQSLRAKISEVEDMTENLRLNVQKKLTDGFYPFEFQLTRFDSLKRRKESYTSPPLYTHPGGYKFRIDVLPAGEGMAVGTHMCVNIVSLKGEFDPILTFPVTFIVTIQILNHYNDSGHYTREIDCTYPELTGSEQSQEIGSEFEFILLKELYWNEENQTIYLKNEVVRFRATKILFVSDSGS